MIFESRPRLDRFLGDRAVPLFEIDFNGLEDDDVGDDDALRWSGPRFLPSLGPLETDAAVPRDVDATVTEDGTAHALLVWWHMDFPRLFDDDDATHSRVLSTGPLLDAALGGETGDVSLDDDDTAHWRCAGFVLNEGAGIPLRAGDVLRLRIAFRYSNVHVLAWEKRIAGPPPPERRSYDSSSEQ
mmetsp:Transcript_5492/g.17985  ORF Transcript_5492/g.17985 Transcript_5492/m.17985 type:complete len:185 (+) Transcript_5492:966-1520(+)